MFLIHSFSNFNILLHSAVPSFPLCYSPPSPFHLSYITVPRSAISTFSLSLILFLTPFLFLLHTAISFVCPYLSLRYSLISILLHSALSTLSKFLIIFLILLHSAISSFISSSSPLRLHHGCLFPRTFHFLIHPSPNSNLLASVFCLDLPASIDSLFLC